MVFSLHLFRTVYELALKLYSMMQQFDKVFSKKAKFNSDLQDLDTEREREQEVDL